MHDIDRTLADFEPEMEAYETDQDQDEFGEFEQEYEYEYEYEGTESAFNEEEEMELAAELLEVTDEEDLDQFLGKLMRRAGKRIRKAVRSPVGRTVRRALRNVAKKALPTVGSALGSAVAPGVGTAVGGALGKAASNLFEMELEGLSPEDQEFEVAKRVVRFAGEAAKNAALARPNAKPEAAAKTAIINAAKKHAPGLLRREVSSTPANKRQGTDGASGRGGRWIRRGRNIVLLGV
jgi:uncharacterized protein (DUF697 family)